MTREEFFGLSLHYYRKKNGWSQEKLSEIIGVSPRTIQKLESGGCLPSLRLMLRIAETFNTTMDDMLKMKSTSEINLREIISNMSLEDRNQAIIVVKEIYK